MTIYLGTSVVERSLPCARVEFSLFLMQLFPNASCGSLPKPRHVFVRGEKRWRQQSSWEGFLNEIVPPIIPADSDLFFTFLRTLGP